MGLSKLLIVLALVGIIYLVLQRIKGGSKGIKQPAPDNPKMVKCSHCHVYLPQDQALAANTSTEQWFCSTAHQQDYLSKHDS